VRDISRHAAGILGEYERSCIAHAAVGEGSSLVSPPLRLGGRRRRGKNEKKKNK